MNAEQFINFAGKIAAMGPAGARSTVSRAYYGVFHLALDVLGELAAPANAHSHVLVPRMLLSVNHPDSGSAAHLLVQLRGERNKVDYRLRDARVETAEYAKCQVEAAAEAQRYLKAFQAVLAAEQSWREQLREGIARVKSLHGI